MSNCNKPIYEFLVWDNCNNKCKFCWQRENPRLFNLKNREKVLNEVINFINSDNFINESNLLIVGGEIFDQSSNFPILNKFFNKIIEFMKLNIIDLLYVNTNLIYKDLTGLNDLLNKLTKNNLIDRLRFTTSYDLIGRFKDKESELLMLNNLKEIQEKFKINIVVNTILTKPVCDSILSREFNVYNFMKKYKCWVNLIPYIVYDKSLSADRNLIFKTLNYINKNIIGYIDRYKVNLKLNPDRRLFMYMNDKFISCSSENSSCGHSKNFKMYSTKNTCFICDIERIFK